MPFRRALSAAETHFEAQTHQPGSKANSIASATRALRSTAGLFNQQFHSGLRRNETSGLGTCVFRGFVVPDNFNFGWIVPRKVRAANPTVSESTISVANGNAEELVSLTGF
jgi:hypothetical protein